MGEGVGFPYSRGHPRLTNRESNSASMFWTRYDLVLPSAHSIFAFGHSGLISPDPGPTLEVEAFTGPSQNVRAHGELDARTSASSRVGPCGYDGLIPSCHR